MSQHDIMDYIFSSGQRFEHPATELMEILPEVEKLGLVTLEYSQRVLCVNENDKDILCVEDSECDGEIDIRPYLCEEEGDYFCPKCRREIYPSQKQRFITAIICVNEEAITSYLQTLISTTLECEVQHNPRGLFCARTAGGDVQVCVIDWCVFSDPSVLQAGYPRADKTLYLFLEPVSNAPYFHVQTSPDRLSDLIYTDAIKYFKNRLRKLSKPSSHKVLPVAYPRQTNATMTSYDAIPANSQNPPTNKLSLPVPLGTRWDQIEMYFLDGTTLAVKIRDGKYRHFTHEAFGMCHKQSKKPTQAWYLLATLCEKHGRCTVKEAKFKSTTSASTQCGQLRRQLQEIFTIKTNPVSCSSKDRIISCKFKAYPDSPSKETYVDRGGW